MAEGTLETVGIGAAVESWFAEAGERRDGHACSRASSARRLGAVLGSWWAARLSWPSSRVSARHRSPSLEVQSPTLEVQSPTLEVQSPTLESSLTLRRAEA